MVTANILLSFAYKELKTNKEIVISCPMGICNICAEFYPKKNRLPIAHFTSI
jgi:hypothetical protein